jgi:hypothetical protein
MINWIGLKRSNGSNQNGANNERVDDKDDGRDKANHNKWEEECGQRSACCLHVRSLIG